MNVLQVKAAVRERDGQRCTECGMTNARNRERTGRQLDVHRKIPGSEYTIEGCVTLCRRCHGKHRRPPGDMPLSPFQVRLPIACADWLRAYQDQHRAKHRYRPPYTVLVQTAVEEFLQRAGLWPPPDPKS